MHPSPFPVVIADPQTPEQLALWQSLSSESGLSFSAPGQPGPDALMPLLAGASGLVTQHVAVDAALLQAAPNLRVIQKMGGRRDLLDLPAIRARGVAAALMPLPGSVAVAEHAIALMLACGKQILPGHRLTASGAYRNLGIEPKTTSERVHGFQWMKLPGLVEFRGLTMGIFGFGDIGSEIARRAAAFEMEIIYHKRSRLAPDLEAELGARYVSKAGLLAQSDVLVMISPLTPETEKAIGAAELAQMKPEAILVNVSRGGVIDEDALVKALQAGQIARAGLDVFVQEPIPYDHPLLALENVVLTPHIAAGKGGARERQTRAVIENLARFTAGQPMKYAIS